MCCQLRKMNWFDNNERDESEIIVQTVWCFYYYIYIYMIRQNDTLMCDWYDLLW